MNGIGQCGPFPEVNMNYSRGLDLQVTDISYSKHFILIYLKQQTYTFISLSFCNTNKPENYFEETNKVSS